MDAIVRAITQSPIAEHALNVGRCSPDLNSSIHLRGPRFGGSRCASRLGLFRPHLGAAVPRPGSRDAKRCPRVSALAEVFADGATVAPRCLIAKRSSTSLRRGQPDWPEILTPQGFPALSLSGDGRSTARVSLAVPRRAVPSRLVRDRSRVFVSGCSGPWHANRGPGG